MEKIDYKTLIKLLKKYDKEITRVFNKLQKASHETKANILDCGRYSVFGRTEWYCSDENHITVRYYDDDYEYVTSTLTIPADILFDDTKIDEWIKSKVDKALEERELKLESIKKLQEEKERQEYERLKEKFEK